MTGLSATRAITPRPATTPGKVLGLYGLKVAPLKDLPLEQLSRMASESRYPVAEEAPLGSP
jgi:hypothetical protein